MHAIQTAQPRALDSHSCAFCFGIPRQVALQFDDSRLPPDPHQGCVYYRLAVMAVVGQESSGKFEPLPVGDINSGVSARFVTISSAFRVADKKAYDKAEREKENRSLLNRQRRRRQRQRRQQQQ